MLWEKELQVARSAAMHAGDLAVGYQSQELKPDAKPDLSPVTIADRECEKLLVAEILQAFPDDGILGEEGRRGTAAMDANGFWTRSMGHAISSAACRFGRS